MDKPDDIPQDVWAAAERAYGELHGIENDDGQEPWSDEDTAIIARAIMAAVAAESERCAKIVEAHDWKSWRDPELAEVIVEDIAKSVRETE